MKQIHTLAILAVIAIGISPAFADTGDDSSLTQEDAAWIALDKEFGIVYPELTDAQLDTLFNLRLFS